MMKRWKEATLAVLLVTPAYVGLASGNVPEETSADPDIEGEQSAKEEVIYGNLNANGSLSDLYVVNMLDVTSPGKVTDYGSYDEVTNLTNLNDIVLDRDEVEVVADEGLFYYQGNLHEAELPWYIAITYRLDGEAVEAEDLAGAEGLLHVRVETRENQDMDPTFYENYTLQVAMGFDASVANVVEAPDATIANAGKERQLSYTVMPEADGDMEFFANVNDFEMNAIEIAAIPMTLAMEDPDTEEMTGELRDLSDGIADIHDGVGDLNSGVGDVNDGLRSLADGSSDYLSGMQEVDAFSGGLVHGSAEIRDGLKELNRELSGASFSPDLSGLTELTDGLGELSQGIEELSGGLDLLDVNYSEAKQVLDEAIGAIPEGALSEEEIKSLYMEVEDPEILDELVDNYEAAQRVKATYSEIQEAFDAVSSTLAEATGGLGEIVYGIDQMADEIAAAMQELENPEALEQLEQLEAGVAQLTGSYQDFHHGLVSYTDGVGDLADHYSEIDSGVDEVTSGTSELGEGTSDLTEGTAELRNNTTDLPEQIQDEVDQMMAEYDKSDYEPVSFVSDKNDQVGVVQFVLRTEAIELPDEEDDELEEDEDENWFDRILQLFN
ncbi:YhgE/Pip domain-containing protein [Salisediminibacterium beveridgei]|uniref:X-X-X-Leu-X-X-Gly heptad repeat-containing protein n=1 Tax=Salisediminibacterium beveridgei TaxID=632773 RepID=A0A1D7QZ29_9BACI|nr:hypothetical protein [Salisediminibacterium beveridgei]AOM84261.1 hypothetical protein BBEV_2936 [Salisediminibacterium beveridgei]